MATSKNADNLKNELSNAVEIKSLIYVVRGCQVMLDSDLAMLYQIETKVLNQAAKRNISRFPEHYRFQLSNDEYENLKSQIVTSSLDVTQNNYGGRRKLPFVYTEQGIAMLSSVLRSDVAIQVNMRIIDTFVEIRKYLANTSLIYDRVNAIEMRQISYQEETDRKFEQVFDYIADQEGNNQKIFFAGQIFDAFSLLTDLVHQADKNIILIDGYVDIATLNILAKKKEGVDVVIFTFPKTKLTKQDIDKFNSQYPNLQVNHTNAFHDRFMIIDDNVAYHIGASIKDAGNKCFGINRIEDSQVIDELLKRAMES